MSDHHPISSRTACKNSRPFTACNHAVQSPPASLTRRTPPFMALLLAVVILLLFQAPAMAHRVNIFAWTEGPQVLVKCGFSGGSNVKSGEITVYDAASEKVLLQGRTNTEGLFRFDIPPAGKEHGLRIRINAGEGHQNEWHMEAAELAQAPASTAAGTTSALPENAGAIDPQKMESAKASQPAALPANSNTPTPGVKISGSGPVSAEEVRGIVDAALNAQTDKFNALLDARLSPLRRQLAEMRTEGPGLREIVGGVGWFVGLAGLALYFRSRRR